MNFINFRFMCYSFKGSYFNITFVVMAEMNIQLLPMAILFNYSYKNSLVINSCEIEDRNIMAELFTYREVKRLTQSSSIVKNN